MESTRLSSRHFVRVWDDGKEKAFGDRPKTFAPLPAATVCPVDARFQLKAVNCSFVVHANPGDIAPTTVPIPVTTRRQGVRSLDGFYHELDCWDINRDQSLGSEGLYQHIFCLVIVPPQRKNGTVSNGEQVRVAFYAAGQNIESPFSWKTLDFFSFTTLSVGLERYLFGPPEMRGRSPKVHSVYTVEYAQRYTRFWSDDDLNPASPSLGFSFGWGTNTFDEFEETNLYTVNQVIGVVGGMCFLFTLLNVAFTPLVAWGFDRVGACKPPEGNADDYAALGGRHSNQLGGGQGAGLQLDMESTYEAPTPLLGGEPRADSAAARPPDRPSLSQ